MRLNRLLPGLTLVGALMLALPAEAARLQFWRFDTEENKLTFTTDDSVEPTAQLISEPTRLVIDLPGTSLSRPETQSMDGAIKEIRVDELDDDTTRMVVEYNDGYTVDPSQVQVRGESARRWTVKLPDAIALDNKGSDQPVAQSNRSPAQENRVSNKPVQGAETRIQAITATSEGFFIRTAGEEANVSLDRFEENGQRYITLTFDQTAVALGVTGAKLPINRYSIRSWVVNQISASPAKAEITLALDEASPDWDISTLSGGVLVQPQNVSIGSVPDAGRPSTSTAAAGSDRQTAAVRQLDAGELPTVPNGRFTVVIDPGHGGRDPGAVGIGGLQEKVVVNDVAPRVAEILREQGVNVVMTRDSDIEVDLAPRVQTAERANASIFVSIHANAISMSRPDVNGLETFYASDSGQRLANTVHDTVLRAMGMRDRRVRSARFYVIRRTSMPAILIETGFVTGAEDAPNLADPAWRDRMAQAIAQGILLHLQRGL
ncbi:MAG: N-acetylmuramoyl-L-alanine amidase [Phormidesmis sp.]